MRGKLFTGTILSSKAKKMVVVAREYPRPVSKYKRYERSMSKMHAYLPECNITPYSLGNYIYRSILNLLARKRPKQKPITKVEASGDIILAQYPELIKKTSDTTGTESNEDPNELIQDAMEYLKKGDYINAVEYSEKAITIKPRIALAYNTKGQALFNLKKI